MPLILINFNSLRKHSNNLIYLILTRMSFYIEDFISFINFPEKCYVVASPTKGVIVEGIKTWK